MILGRMQAKAMGYVQFPWIIEPHAFTMSTATLKKVCAKVTHTPETTEDCKSKNVRGTRPREQPAQKNESSKATLEKESKQTDEPVIPKVKWNQDSINLNGKVHKLPITKEYMLKEYSDVFKGIGTLPGGPYIKEHTEWINSIVPVMKSNGSLRLCLDPKDLNKVIKRNQWYSRTIDDILPELAKSKYKKLKDATSGYWHIVLDLASSLLTMFNTPWGKYRWLRLPFGLKIASDVFQERLDRLLRLLEGVHGIADDILTHGETEVQHDGRLLTLLETARMNNLSLNSLNPDKIQFKSTDCKFFGHRLTLEGLKPDPEKVKAIVQMPPPQSIQSLQSFSGMVNYLKRFSPVLTELAEPLRRLQK